MKGLFVIFLLTSISPVLAAQKNTDDKLPVINIQKTSWKVLFQSSAGPFGSPPPNSGIEKMIGTVAKSLHKLENHVLNENEKNDLREKAIQKELYKHYRAYNSLVDSRDRAVLHATLKSRSHFSQITAQSTEDKKIHKKGRLIQYLQNIKRDLISVPDSLPLEFEDRSGEAYKPPNIILLKEEYDIFIWGVSRGKKNVFQVKIWAYLANARRKVLLWKGIVGRNNYDKVLAMIQAKTSSLLLGRPWASMKVDVETSNDSDAQIYLDGQLQGENSLTVYGLYPKQAYELEIIASGLQGKHFFVELEPGTLNSFQFKLDIKVPEKYITVDASETAEVYLGVRYLGTSPLEVRVPAYATLLVIVAENKRSINYDLEPEQEDDLFFHLEVAPEITLKEENNKRRTRFYWSSALFMISLAIPVLAAGIGFVNQGLYVNNQANSDAPGYRQSMYIGFGVAIGGGILSGTLLGLNIYDFIQYTKSTRALATTEFEPHKLLPETAQNPDKPAK